jgi:hypothetical protein
VQLLTTYRTAFADLVSNHQARIAGANGVLNPQVKIIADGLHQLLSRPSSLRDALAPCVKGIGQFSEGVRARNHVLAGKINRLPRNPRRR